MTKLTILKLITTAAVGVLTASAANLVTVATFNSAQGQQGENLVFDVHENLYVTLAFSNEVVKITPGGVQSPYATFDGPPGSLTTGLAIDDSTGDLFVGYTPAGQNGVIYVVHPDHSKAVIATFPAGVLVNGMTPDVFGNIYVADSFLGYVWRVRASGGTPEIWVDLHAPGSLMAGLGPNGIKFDAFQQNLYVTVPNQGLIYRIPRHMDGSAGTPVVHARNLPLTIDDIGLDLLGNVYVATQTSMSVLRVLPDGTQQTLATAADGLQRTAAVLFGRRGPALFHLYILSALYAETPDAHNGVYMLDVGLPGFPVSIP
jgi:sugar lactone lactonase YvrE